MSKYAKKSRKFYQEKIKELMSNICYIPQAGERITQCISPFPAYWFISNMGYLLSAYTNTLMIVKPMYEPMKKYKNEWCYEYYDDNGKRRKIRMQRLIAIHYLTEHPKETPLMPEDEVHHIKKTLSFSPNQPQWCNRVTNLQVLSPELHRYATAYSKTTWQEDQEKLKELIERDNPIHESLPKGGLDPYAEMIVRHPNLFSEAALVIKDDDKNTMAFPANVAMKLLGDYVNGNSTAKNN